MGIVSGIARRGEARCCRHVFVTRLDRPLQHRQAVRAHHEGELTDRCCEILVGFELLQSYEQRVLGKDRGGLGAESVRDGLQPLEEPVTKM